jgi:glycosyltransferase involved in cell wall biosynthesis
VKVLNVIPIVSSRIGGPALNLVQSAIALRDVGVDSTIFATDLSLALSARSRMRVGPGDLPPGADSVDLRLFPARMPYRLAYAPALGRQLRREVTRYDAVHIHSLFLYPQFAAYRSARAAAVPYIVAPCGALDPELRARNRLAKSVTDVLWQRQMLNGAAVLHYKTEEEAMLVADLAFSPPRRVIPNGIHWDEFQSLPPRALFRDAYLGGADEPVILFLGRLSHKKGLDILLDAFQRLRRTLPATLVIAGPDDETLAPAILRQAAALGVGERVQLTGMLDRETRRAALSAADVWVLPSRTENFGTAVVEALAAGVPAVISTAVNLAPDLQAAEAALVVPVEAGPVADALIRVLTEPETAKRLSEKGRELARRFDWSVVAPQLRALYEGAA